MRVQARSRETGLTGTNLKVQDVKPIPKVHISLRVSASRSASVQQIEKSKAAEELHDLFVQKISNPFEIFYIKIKDFRGLNLAHFRRP